MANYYMKRETPCVFKDAKSRWAGLEIPELADKTLLGVAKCAKSSEQQISVTRSQKQKVKITDYFLNLYFVLLFFF